MIFFIILVTEGAPMACIKTQAYGIKIESWCQNDEKITVQQLPSQKAICCTFLFNYCTLIFLVVQELPNVHHS